MKKAVSITCFFFTYSANLVWKVAYSRGWPALPSELVTTQGCFMKFSRSASFILNDIIEAWPLVSRRMRTAASSGSIFQSLAIWDKYFPVHGRGGAGATLSTSEMAADM